MSVLVVTPWFPPQPGEREGSFVFDQAVALQQAGLRVRVLVTQPWLPDAVRTKIGYREAIQPSAFRTVGLPVETVEYPPLSLSRLDFLAAPATSPFIVSAISRIDDLHGADIIHAHTEDLAYAVAHAACKTRRPAVLTIHGANPALQRASGRRLRQLKWALGRLDRVILVGPSMKGPWRQFEPAAKLEVVLNGFQLPDHLPSSACAREHTVRIVSVANLHANKGVDITIKAMAALAFRGYGDVEFVIVGDGAERPALKHLAAALGLDSRVHFLGYVPHREALAEIAAADIFCVPSWREACGIAHMEAMGLAKVVIGCRTQGPSAFIEHGRTGYLVEPRDVYGLAEVLQRAIAVPDERERIARAARIYAQANLTWRANADRIVEIYRSVCSSPDAQAMPARLH